MARPARDGPNPEGSTPALWRDRPTRLGATRPVLIMTMIVSKVTSRCESVGFAAVSMPKVRRIATHKTLIGGKRRAELW